jgi:hypothetical protein
MQAFGGEMKYILNEEEFSVFSSNQPFLGRFMTGFSKLISFYRASLFFFLKENRKLLTLFFLETLV